MMEMLLGALIALTGVAIGVFIGIAFIIGSRPSQED